MGMTTQNEVSWVMEVMMLKAPCLFFLLLYFPSVAYISQLEAPVIRDGYHVVLVQTFMQTE
jgi:hypothetical protein